jgi:hypothetical protein
MKINWRTIAPIVVGVPLVFVAWGAGMAALALFQPAGQPVAVFARGGMAEALRAVVAADGYILQVRGETVIAVSNDDGFALRLYRSGALAVVAASAAGCIVGPADRS